LNLTMDRNWNITATFAINTYTLSASVVGSGAVTKSPNQASYNHGTVVQLTATPAAGWQFTGWSGDTSGTANPISMTMDRNKSVTATFYSSGFTLAYTVVGRGAVSVSPDQESYANGTLVILTASPGAGYQFVGWSGDANGTANPLTMTMNGDKSVTVTFADLTAPAVHVASPNGGEVVSVGGVAHLSWTATDGAGDPATVDILLSRGGSGGIFQAIATGVPNTGSYDWSVTSPPSTAAYIKVEARDQAGNLGSDKSDISFTISGTTGVGDAPVAEFALSRVSPNPTRGRALVEYSVPVAARVKLSVVDLQGRIGDVLAEGVLPPGRYQSAWDGHRNQGLNAGLYFLRYEVPGRTFTRRLVVAR